MEGTAQLGRGSTCTCGTHRTLQCSRNYGARVAARSLPLRNINVITRRFVLDIRNNGGGLFPAGVEVARQWLDAGDIVLIADSQGVRDSYEADGRALDAGSPLSVLVNRGTASASEARGPPLSLSWVYGWGRWGCGCCMFLAGSCKWGVCSAVAICAWMPRRDPRAGPSAPAWCRWCLTTVCAAHSHSTSHPLMLCHQQVLAGALKDAGRARVVDERTSSRARP